MRRERIMKYENEPITEKAYQSTFTFKEEKEKKEWDTRMNQYQKKLINLHVLFFCKKQNFKTRGKQATLQKKM